MMETEQCKAMDPLGSAWSTALAPDGADRATLAPHAGRAESWSAGLAERTFLERFRNTTRPRVPGVEKSPCPRASCPNQAGASQPLSRC